MTELNNAEDRESQAVLSKCMTCTAACLAQNVNLSPKVLSFLSKIIKKAEKSYVKCKKLISNSFLEKTKKYIHYLKQGGAP